MINKNYVRISMNIDCCTIKLENLFVKIEKNQRKLIKVTEIFFKAYLRWNKIYYNEDKKPEIIPFNNFIMKHQQNLHKFLLRTELYDIVT